MAPRWAENYRKVVKQKGHKVWERIFDFQRRCRLQGREADSALEAFTGNKEDHGPTSGPPVFLSFPPFQQDRSKPCHSSILQTGTLLQGAPCKLPQPSWSQGKVLVETDQFQGCWEARFHGRGSSHHWQVEWIKPDVCLEQIQFFRILYTSSSWWGRILPTRGHLAMSEDIFGSHTGEWQGGRLLLASREQRPGLLPNILPRKDGPPTPKKDVAPNVNTPRSEKPLPKWPGSGEARGLSCRQTIPHTHSYLHQLGRGTATGQSKQSALGVYSKATEIGPGKDRGKAWV